MLHVRRLHTTHHPRDRRQHVVALGLHTRLAVARAVQASVPGGATPRLQSGATRPRCGTRHSPCPARESRGWDSRCRPGWTGAGRLLLVNRRRARGPGEERGGRRHLAPSGQRVLARQLVGAVVSHPHVGAGAHDESQPSQLDLAGGVQSNMPYNRIRIQVPAAGDESVL